jgi:hypothetical protein
MAACFHVAGVQCDNCRTGLKDDRPYVAVVTTGGTYLSAQDFLTALRQVEIERDEARGEVERLIARLTAAEAKAAVSGGDWCRQNRAEGRGPCGACALCVAELQRRVEAMDTEHRAWHKMADKAIEAQAERDAYKQERDVFKARAESAYCDDCDKLRASDDDSLRTTVRETLAWARSRIAYCAEVEERRQEKRTLEAVVKMLLGNAK